MRTSITTTDVIRWAETIVVVAGALGIGLAIAFTKAKSLLDLYWSKWEDQNKDSLSAKLDAMTENQEKMRKTLHEQAQSLQVLQSENDEYRLNLRETIKQLHDMGLKLAETDKQLHEVTMQLTESNKLVRTLTADLEQFRAKAAIPATV
jgi:chromosome segregation ATPase